MGWAIGERMTADLVLAALNMALEQRKPEGGVIHHSDQGSQYTSIAFGNRCAQMGVRPSMGTVGDAYDNAMAESFFASLECELIERRSWRTLTEARLALFTWIEAWYNPRRRHSGLGQVSPANFERNHHDNTCSRRGCSGTPAPCRDGRRLPATAVVPLQRGCGSPPRPPRRPARHCGAFIRGTGNSLDCPGHRSNLCGLDRRAVRCIELPLVGIQTSCNTFDRFRETFMARMGNETVIRACSQYEECGSWPK